MHLPAHFREDHREAQHELIRAHPLGTLVSAGPGGLMANLVPFLIYPDEGEHGVLRAHVARANPLWQRCPTGTPVLVDGVLTRTLGRVSMDMITVDLEPVPQAAPGSEVTLWGEGPGGSRLPIDEVARTAGTLGYELMCALAQRVPVRTVD